MLNRASWLAAAVLVAGLAPAFAQAPPPMGGQQPPCMNDFMPLRNDAEKKAAAVRAAHDKKATPQEACRLIGAFAEAEGKVLKYVEKNGSWCGIPQQVVQGMKTNHAHTEELRRQICMAAANPPRPPGPTLSDALDPSATTGEARSVKPGRGTFDTLTGNALAR